MGLSESLAAIFAGVSVKPSGPDAAADYDLFIHGQKEAVILVDPLGTRTWSESRLLALWNLADNLAVIPLVASKIHGKWYYMDLNWGSVPALVPDFETKQVEIWFKGYNPISELLEHIEKRRKEK